MPIQYQIQFKIAVLCTSVNFHRRCPQYIFDLVSFRTGTWDDFFPRRQERPAVVDHGSISADEHAQSPVLLFGTTCLNPGFVQTFKSHFPGLSRNCKDQIPGFSRTQQTRFQRLSRTHSIYKHALHDVKNVRITHQLLV